MQRPRSGEILGSRAQDWHFAVGGGHHRINIERTCCTRAAPSQRRLSSRALDQPQQPCSAGRSSDLLPQANGVGEMRVRSCTEAISG